MNEQDMNFLLDQLSNSMEFYDEAEFVNHIGNQTNISKKDLKIIFNEYWALEPTERMNFGFDPEENEEWVLNIINK
jgi:hypothetical protein